MKKIIFLLLGCFALSAGCSGKTDADFSVDANSVKAVVADNTDFALSMYGKLTEDSAVNVFFSPYSVSTALALVYAGAHGQTQTQMAAVLYFTAPNEKLFPAFGELQKQLIQQDNSNGWQMLMANALWLQEGVPFLQEFLNLTASFDAGRYQLDFANETEIARQKINTWVQEQTKGKIKDLVPPDGVDVDTVLVIANAVYFLGEWKNKFNAELTQDADFYVLPRKKIDAHLMNLQETFRYYADESLQALELPYKSDDLSMVVILPVQKYGLKEIEKKLTAKMLTMILPKMEKKEVDVYLPKFKITWGTTSLKNALTALGMPDAFEFGKADFSGMTGQNDLYLSDVFHKAVVEVNEEGTEAAAATAAPIAASAIPDISVFRADHPFLFMIRDNCSGSILFIGRLTDPSAEE